MSLSCEMLEGLDFLNLNTTSMMSASILFVYRSQYDNDKLRNVVMNLDVAGLQRLTSQKVNILAGRVQSKNCALRTNRFPSLRALLRRHSVLWRAAFLHLPDGFLTVQVQETDRD